MDRLAAMRLFVRVAELGSFTQAAESLGVSPATATERVSRLETALAVKLFVRTTRRVALTPEGVRYFDVCSPMIAALDDVESEIGERLQRNAGPVAFGCNTGVARGIVLRALPAFLAIHPELSLRLVMADHRNDFVREGLDFVVRIGGLEDQALVLRRVAVPRRITVAAPSYLDRHGTPQSPDDLTGHTIIDFLLPRPGERLDWEFEEAGGRYERNFPATVSINDAQARVDLAEAGLGIAQTLCFLAADGLTAGRLVRLLPAWETEAPGISILYPRTRYLPQRVRLSMAFVESVIRTAIERTVPDSEQRYRPRPQSSERVLGS